jgi:Meckel syndrome type 1 protein
VTSRVVALVAAGLALASPAAYADPAQVARRSTDGVDAVTRGPSVDERLAIIAKRVQAAATYPALAQVRRVQGTSVVVFEIGADGAARDVAVATSSGSPQLDRAAERAVRDAGALPWVYGRLEVPVRFELSQR